MKDFERLNGLIAATFTPMKADGSLNLEAVTPYADMIADNGLRGVFVCGTTGESHSMSVAERKAELEAWVRAARGRFKVVAHVGSNSQVDAVELAAHAQQAGADAIGAMSPTFFKPATPHDLAVFMQPVAAAAASLPFYYYHIPAMTGVSLSVPAFLDEAKQFIPNLAGVKYSHNNLMEMQECLALDGGAFEILHGYDEYLLAGLALGAKGGVGSTYNYAPRVYQGIVKAFGEGNMELARKYQLQSVDIVEVIIRHGGGVRGGKAIMNVIGIDCGNCRPPFAPFTAEELLQVRKELDAIGFQDPL